MNELFAIQASIVTEEDGWHGMKHLPTFYLHANVQGILTEAQACRVARSILDPFNHYGERLALAATKL